MKKKLIIKIGSSTLTKGSPKIKRGKIEDVAQQIESLKAHYHIAIVSSGAVAAARQFIDLTGRDLNNLALKQALAAIGQPALMKIYQEVFADFNLQVAQCLLTYYDFNNEASNQNILNTIEALWENDYIPIINENDTVATEEIRFGDNDKLAALTAGLVQADLCILASDIDGLYTADPNLYPEANFIHTVDNIDSIRHLAGETASNLGSGGMRSKLVAAEICKEASVEMWIVNGQQDNFLLEAFESKRAFTRFV